MCRIHQYNIENNGPGEAVDAVASEIQKRWPDATGMDFFPGQERYSHSHTDRFENYRESAQKHAMLSAATTLMQTRPVMRDSYEPANASPWVEWLQEYDVSSEDGAWLADRKDAVPEQAKQFLVVRDRNKDVLEKDEDILRKIGLLCEDVGEFVPLHSSWQSSDGVAVRVRAALTQPKGTIGRCKAFSRKPNHEIWLPTFSSDGDVDRHMGKSDFEPLIWAPERYPMGIDTGDKFATNYPVIRPRLGKTLTSKLGLQPDDDDRDWLAQDGSLAMRSQVWGQWRPDPDNHQGWYKDEGVILWAQPDWLDIALSKLDRRIVFYVDLV